MYHLIKVKQWELERLGYWVEYYSHPLGFVVAMKTPYTDWKGVDCITRDQADRLFEDYIEWVRNETMVQ